MDKYFHLSPLYSSNFRKFDMKKILSRTELADRVSTTNPTLSSNPLYAEIVKGLYQGNPLLGEGGLLTDMVKELTQLALQGEFDSHMQGSNLEDGNNRRNGLSLKTIKTGSGSFELETPRDRNSSFEPQLVKKRQTILNDELDNKILALYALGTGYDGIANHLAEIYGVDVSAATISSVTDKLVPQIA